MSGLGRCADLRNPDFGGSTVLNLIVKFPKFGKIGI